MSTDKPTFTVSRAVQHGFTVHLRPPSEASMKRARKALADAKAMRLAGPVSDSGHPQMPNDEVGP